MIHYRVFLHLEDTTPEIEDQILKFLKNDETCISVTKTIGYCDLEFRSVVKNIEDFYNLIERLRRAFPHQIKDYESIIYYKMHDVWNYFPFKT